ncbi:DUF4153 domain-containing protein [Streptomyces lavendulocolor]|uniref:DUF4153 domain-containing protein n=1 Tax=Streptomyces lavendulocolor TaxID=67316 RepID=UPI003C2CDD1F
MPQQGPAPQEQPPSSSSTSPPAPQDARPTAASPAPDASPASPASPAPPAASIPPSPSPSPAPTTSPPPAAGDARARAGAHAGGGAGPVPGWPATAVPPYRPPSAPASLDTWLTRIRPRPPGPIPAAALWSALATAVLSALLLGDGLGLNLLLVAVPASLTAYFAAAAAGRRVRPWTVVWGLGGLALLVVPALRDAGWPTFLAVVAALGLASLALHGSRGWRGIVLGPFGLFDSIVPGVLWAGRGLRERAGGAQGRVAPVLRTTAVAVGLLVVFGGLFAGADAAFADLLGSLVPDVSVTEGPWRSLLFVLGLLGALAAARTAAAPLRWDSLKARPGRPRSRLEWALPLIVLDLLFAVFNAVQLAVLFGGYEKVLSQTGLTYAEYARQGFWQLLWATLLTLAVIGLALRWAPRGGARDRTLVRSVLGTLCLLTLVVVASALRRMDLYVDAYGLTRLRVSVAAMELWLGVVLVLLMVAGVVGARRLQLPRAVAVSAAAGVLAFGIASPDGLVAERNVERYETTGKIDVGYLEGLSADAAPALDRLPEPLRSCALRTIAGDMYEEDKPWYAVSLAEVRARDIVEDRALTFQGYICAPERDEYGGEREEYGEFDEHGEVGSD